MYDKFFFIDFDGTITLQDSLDLLFDNFADISWKTNDAKWENTEIGSLENLTKSFSTFEISKNKLDFIIDLLKVDYGFYNFLTYINDKKYGHMILSEGIDYIIRETLLKNAPKDFDISLVKNINISSNCFKKNKIIFMNNSNNCINIKQCKKCSNCKYKTTKDIEAKNKLYIGDGLSDRYGILNCDIVYAKNKLLNYCRKIKTINYIEINNFNEIREKIGLMSDVSLSG